MSKSRKKFTDVQRPQVQQYCGGKLCLSKAEAHARINGTKRRQHSNSSKMIPKRAYLCPMCGCYHLTHLAKYSGDSDYD